MLAKIAGFLEEEVIREFGGEKGAEIVIDSLKGLKRKVEESCSILTAAYAYVRNFIDTVKAWRYSQLSGGAEKSETSHTKYLIPD